LQIERATLRPGCLVAVLDLSANGAQVQSERPMRPGSRIHVRIAARGGTLAVAADVVRCSVWIVQADAVIYRAALRFGGVRDVLGRAGRLDGGAVVTKLLAEELSPMWAYLIRARRRAPVYLGR
jgi:hypothetical protein